MADLREFDVQGALDAGYSGAQVQWHLMKELGYPPALAKQATAPREKMGPPEAPRTIGLPDDVPNPLTSQGAPPAPERWNPGAGLDLIGNQVGRMARADIRRDPEPSPEEQAIRDTWRNSLPPAQPLPADATLTDPGILHRAEMERQLAHPQGIVDATTGPLVQAATLTPPGQVATSALRALANPSDIPNIAREQFQADAPMVALPGMGSALAETGQKLKQGVKEGLQRFINEDEGALWLPGRTKLADINKKDYVVPVAGNRLKKEDIMRYMERQVQTHLGAIDPDAPPRVKLQRLLRLGRRELEDQLTQENPNLDFYIVDTPQANADMVQMFPELATDSEKMTLTNAASAVLAQGSNPGAEAMNGGRAYNYYRQHGRLPEVQPDDAVPGQRAGKQWSTTGGSDPIIKLNGFIDMFKSSQDPTGLIQLERVLTGDYPVGYLKTINPNVKGRAGDFVPGAMILGPKIGSYFLDISGIPQKGATVDMWDTLAHHRRMGYLFTPGGKPITAPQKNMDRQIFQDFHGTLENEFGLDRTQSQSGLWHYEKELYKRLGVPSIVKGRSDGTRVLLDAWGYPRQNIITRENAPARPLRGSWIAPQVPEP